MKVRLLIFTLGFILSSFMLEVQNSDNSINQFEEWVPTVIPSEWVNITIRVSSDPVITLVTITFPSTGYNITDWGVVQRNDAVYQVITEIWMWTGPSFPMIMAESHTYSFKQPEPGNYVFSFHVWGTPVKNVSFTIPGKPPPDPPELGGGTSGNKKLVK